MTALRPEREGTDRYGGEGADGYPSYEDTGQFAAAVEQLDDPLTDPLPGRRPTPGTRQAQPPQPPRQAQPQPQQRRAHAKPQTHAQPPRGPVNPEEAGGSPWFRPHAEPAAAPAPAPAPGPAPAPSPAAAAGPRLQPDHRLAPPEPSIEPEPYLDPEPAPAPDADPVPTPAPAVPSSGGRAARRKAAQEQSRRKRRGGGHGKRATTAVAAAGGAAAASGPSAPPAPPTSRVAARKAARAAKDSPGVVASRVLGELFITFGVLMLLFVAYQLWWTNVLAHKAANGAAKNLEQEWEDSKGEQRAPGAFEPGQGFAIMYIPKLDVKVPIAEGIDKHKVLDKGMLGHYSGDLETAMPWDKKGNFAVAGHRNTHGEPFRYINKLKPGDKIVVETESKYYTYVMASVLPQTPPSNVDVIGPVPPGSGFTEPGRYITLTTCTPEFTSKYRLIVWGKMAEERPRGKGKPDALVG